MLYLFCWSVKLTSELCQNLHIYTDGCTAEFDDTINYVWSEATIGDKVYGSCPCSEFLPVGLNEANVIIRYCQGTNRDGGMWAVADYSQCATVVNELSQGLCNDLLVRIM